MASRDRDISRKYSSGALKKKRKADLQEKIAKVADKYATICFPKLAKPSPCQPSEAEHGDEQAGKRTSSSETVTPRPGEDEHYHTGPDSDEKTDTDDTGTAMSESDSEVSVAAVEDDIESVAEKGGRVPSVFLSQDPAKWGDVNDDLRRLFCAREPEQNSEIDFKSTAIKSGNRERRLSKEMFYVPGQNGSKHCLLWLLYSPSSKKVFCSVCKMFCPHGTKSHFITGFNDWAHSDIIRKHDSSNIHTDALKRVMQLTKSQLIM